MCIADLQKKIGIVPVHIHDADKYMIRSYIESAKSEGMEVGVIQ